MSCEMVPSIEFFPEVLMATATDHDGVMCDTRQVITDAFNKKYGTNHRPDEIKKWDSIADWAMALGMKEKEAWKVNNGLWYNQELLLSAPPVPGAYEFMEKTYDLGICLPVFSSRTHDHIDSTYEWYERHMPFVGRENIHLCLEDVAAEMTKSWMILRGRRTPIKLFLEDSHSHAKLILENTDASVVLVSNDLVLDHYRGSRLFRISGENGELPTLWPLYAAFFA